MTEATEEYATALRLFDGDPQILYAAGAHAMRMGDTTNAVAWLGKSVRLDPKNRRARGSLVRLSLARGDSTGARTLLDEGLRREPELRSWRALRDSL
jgi:Flp pilus assembly protein TadD